MKFGNLNYLFISFIIPIFIIFFIKINNIIKKRREKFISNKLFEKLSPNYNHKIVILKQILIIFIIIFSILALIQPKWGYKWEKIYRKGRDIFIAVDVSKSMLCSDLKPNRLEVAKMEIKELIRIAQGDRIGLIAFAGTAFVECPLTLDYSALRMFIDDLNPSLIPRGGTNIAAAIYKAIQSFQDYEKRYKALILITDGESHEGDPISAAELANKKGIKIFCIGIGSKEGSPIIINGKILKDRQGKTVITKLDDITLKKIALKTGGAYVNITHGSSLGLNKIYKHGILKMGEKELTSTKQKRYIERFQIPLSIALFLLILEFLLIPYKSIKNYKKDKRISKKNNKILSLLIIIFGFYSLIYAEENLLDKIRRAKELTLQKKYEEALKEWSKIQIELPESPEVNFNVGVIYYRLGKYQKAFNFFEKSTITKNLNLEAKAWYNMGNCLLKMGKLKEALEYYKHALKLNPNDRDIKFNIEYVQKKLREMLEKLKKEQQKNKTKDPLTKEIKRLEKIIKKQAENLIKTKNLIKNYKKRKNNDKNIKDLFNREENIEKETNKNIKNFKKIREYFDKLYNNLKNYNKNLQKNNKNKKNNNINTNKLKNRLKDLSNRIDKAVSFINKALKNIKKSKKDLNNIKNKDKLKQNLDIQKKALENLIKARLQFEDKNRQVNPNLTQKNKNKRNNNLKNKQVKKKKGKNKKNKLAKKKEKNNNKDKKRKISKEQALRFLKTLLNQDKRFPVKPKPNYEEEYIEKDW